MNNVKVIKVQSKKEMKMFISFPHTLYKNYDNYVPDLDSDIEDFFNPKKNRNLAYAEVQPFIAMQDGKIVGRIVGVVSHKSNNTWNKRIVRFTYIEFVDDLEVSKALLDAVAKWGKTYGMNEIQGPMGIIDFDKEGMLIEDFDLPGCFMEFWNPPYYKSHMEQLGFKKGADWLQIRFEVPEQIPPRFQRVADYSKQEFGVHVVRKTKKEITQGYSHKIFELLNESFAHLYGFAPFSEEQAEEVLGRFLPFLDMDMVPIVEDNKGELVGIAVTCRDFSDGIKKTQGKLLPFGWLHLLKAIKLGKQDKAQLMIIGIRPDMQGMGVNATIFAHLIPVFQKLGIKWCETNPQLDTNIRELSQWKPLNPKTVKRRRCWQKDI
jgi:GNAT superfamily N-acetyltransferase